MQQQAGYSPPCALDTLRSAQLGKPREFSLAHSRRPIEFHLQRTGLHTRLLRMARGSRATLTEARAQLAPAVPVVPVRREVLPDLEGLVSPVVGGLSPQPTVAERRIIAINVRIGFIAPTATIVAECQPDGYGA